MNDPTIPGTFQIIEGIATPFWLRALPYAAGVLVITAAAYGLYHHGVSVTTAHYEAVISKADADHATALALLQAKVRQQEQDKAAQLAAIDQQHQQDIANREAISNSTIVGLRAGTVRLRSDIAANEFAASVRLPSAAAGTGKRDAAPGVGLRIADAAIIIGAADHADEVTDQLRACQAVVRADRGQP